MATSWEREVWNRPAPDAWSATRAARDCPSRRQRSSTLCRHIGLHRLPSRRRVTRSHCGTIREVDRAISRLDDSSGAARPGARVSAFPSRSIEIERATQQSARVVSARNTRDQRNELTRARTFKHSELEPDPVLPATNGATARHRRFCRLMAMFPRPRDACLWSISGSLQGLEPPAPLEASEEPGSQRFAGPAD